MTEKERAAYKLIVEAGPNGCPAEEPFEMVVLRELLAQGWVRSHLLDATGSRLYFATEQKPLGG